MLSFENFINSRINGENYDSLLKTVIDAANLPATDKSDLALVYQVASVSAATTFEILRRYHAWLVDSQRLPNQTDPSSDEK